MTTGTVQKNSTTLFILTGAVYAIVSILIVFNAEFSTILPQLTRYGEPIRQAALFILIGVCIQSALSAGLHARFEAPLVIFTLALTARLAGSIADEVFRYNIAFSPLDLPFADWGIVVFHLLVMGMVPLLLKTEEEHKRSVQALALPWVFLIVPAALYAQTRTFGFSLLFSSAYSILLGFALYRATRLLKVERHKRFARIYLILIAADALPLLSSAAVQFLIGPALTIEALIAGICAAAGLLLLTRNITEQGEING